MTDVLSQAAIAFRKFPPWIGLRKWRYKKQFPYWSGTFYGIFQDFADARKAAPPSRAVGYDSEGPSNLYQERLSRVYPSDYPALFWLNRILTKADARVLDFGGHVGITYYSYGKYLHFPQELRWTIVDVPAVAKKGTEIALERGEKRLEFRSSLDPAASYDLLFASGSPQYLEHENLFEIFRDLSRLPDRILLNRIPVHPSRTYVTLQNIGAAFCAYRIYSRPELLKSFQDRGYRIVDEWENLEHKCMHPFDPEYSVESYRGFYLEKA